MPKNNLNENVRAILDIANTKGQITDFVEAFQFAVETLNKMKAATGAELSQLRITFDVAIKDLQSANLKDFTDIKGQLLEQIATALKEQETGLNYMRDWVRNIPQAKTPIKGVDYFDGQNADEEAIIQAVLAQLPPAIVPDVYDDAEIQAQIDEHTKAIEELKSKGGNVAGWGAHPLNIYQSGTIKAETARHINFTGASVSQSNDGVTTVAISGGGGTLVDMETPTDSGDHTNFTIAHTPIAGTFKLFRGGARQKSATDYTLTGTALVLSTALQTGEASYVDYTY